MNREDFIQGVNSAHGDTGKLGDFLEEKSGNPKIGREALTNAVEAYQAALANAEPEPPAQVPEPTRVTASAPVETKAPIAEKQAKLAAKPLPTKALPSLREKLEEKSRGGAEEPDETDNAIALVRSKIFQAASEDPSQFGNLFDVVHAKYVSLQKRMLRRP